MYSTMDNPPTSVVLVAHSMGGIVARLATLQKNYNSESINTIFTLSTPHSMPRITLDYYTSNCQFTNKSPLMNQNFHTTYQSNANYLFLLPLHQSK